MLDYLRDICANTQAKQLGNKIKKDSALVTWLLEQTKNFHGTPSLSERAYAVLNNIATNQCTISQNLFRFKSFEQGYGFCGMANVCECARNSVSSKVKQAKSVVSEQERADSNAKRAATNLKKYGVSNVGQTATAKSRHSEHYSDTALVSQQVAKQKQTMLDKYGVENAGQLDEVKAKKRETMLSKYGVENINQLPESKQRLSDTSKTAWKKRKSEHTDFKKLNDKFKTVCNVEFNITPTEYLGTLGNIWYKFRCLTCNNCFSTWISCGHLPVCKTCHPTIHTYKSGEENEVFNYLKSIGIDVSQRNRSIINPLELDIVCESSQIAIEYCGLYWHSEINGRKHKNYHFDKMMLCKEKGWRLITIFSDEWVTKKSIIKSKLSSIFKKSTDHIGARSCQIVNLQPNDANNFYIQHHIQGGISAETHIGLIYNNKIVAAMSFGKLRPFMNNSMKDGSYELLRYATSLNVQGGAGKLLNYYIKQSKATAIISYADARWSDGKLYTTLGFQQINENSVSPGYWYTKDYITREHRFSHTKGKLVSQGYDSSLTEWEIMQQIGYDRIWDCGQLKFVKNV